jgi:methylphosphotriester-DNA--protein-cysteine methyltransferase
MRVIPKGCPSAHPHHSLEVVSEALRYFSAHFHEEIAMEQVAGAIGISEECLDFCFDQSRGMTPWQALQHHRLNRLFQTVSEQPGLHLRQLIRRCGLAGTPGAVDSFEETFGIDLTLFRRTCRRAAADRQFRRHDARREELVLTPAHPATPRGR